MKVVIAGAGNVGQHIALDLQATGHEVTLLDNDSALVAKLANTLGVPLMLADACEVASLHDAGVAEADVVVAATGDDEDNLVVSLLSKQEFSVPRVVARVNNPKNKWLFNETWGIDVAVSTPHILTAMVEEAVSVGSLVRLMQFRDTSLVEVTLDESAPAIGIPLGQLALPRDTAVVAVIREGRVLAPREDTSLAMGDEVLALVTSEGEVELCALLIGS